LTASVLALLALVGYVSGVTSLYAVSDVTQMAVPTAVGFILLAIGAICARPDAGPMPLFLSDTVGGRVLRRLFPVAVLLPIGLGLLRLAGERAGIYDGDVGTWLFAMSIIGVLVPLTWTLASSLDRAETAAGSTRAALQEAQRERTAFDEAPIGSALASPRGEVQRVNRAFCEMLGYTADHLVGRQVGEFMHHDDRDRTAASIEALATGRLSTYRGEERYVCSDGHVVHARTAVTPIYDDDGAVIQLYAQLEDLTDARLAAVRLEQAQFETLARLAAAAEYRDDDTGQHTRRVGDLSAQIAEKLGLDNEIVRLIRLAAPLHDVGKIGIPDAVLLKPGRFTDRELAHMQRHTTIGAEMLAGGAYPQLAIAEQIAASHHERYDGNGYPQGLAGEDIPIAARIVSVADVFDALTHERPYKEAWPLEKALTELRSQSGRQFDPKVIEAFFQVCADGHLVDNGSDRSIDRTAASRR
jgi:PAS domain S-box-containing protein/putative nucleotidyltransferase with HDIG domain